MKKNFSPVWMLLISFIFFACKKDNYEAPSSELSGRIVYNGEPIHVEFDAVPFQLFQYGFGKTGPLTSTITEDGRYSHMLFDGEYKFVIAPGQGPFMWPQTGGKADSVTITVKGNTTKDIDVVPYYMIRNAQISGSGNNVTAKFGLQQIITGANAKNISKVVLFLNKTQFVSRSYQIARTELAASAITDMNNINLSVAIPAISPKQNYVFARIGVEIAGVEDWLFSQVVKITF